MGQECYQFQQKVLDTCPSIEYNTHMRNDSNCSSPSAAYCEVCEKLLSPMDYVVEDSLDHDGMDVVVCAEGVCRGEWTLQVNDHLEAGSWGWA